MAAEKIVATVTTFLNEDSNELQIIRVTTEELILEDSCHFKIVILKKLGRFYTKEL
jgi:hypothetical protein